MRKYLLKVVLGMLFIGVAFSLYPFIKSMGPSEAALARQGQVVIDLSTISKGEAIEVRWDNMPVIVLHRSEEQLAKLEVARKHRINETPNTNVPDPYGLLDEYRSYKKEYFVVYGWTGNSIQASSSFVKEENAINLIGSLNGGFEEQARGAWHDVAGYLLQGSWPYGGDLPIPPHKYLDDTTIKLGPVTENRLKKWSH